MRNWKASKFQEVNYANSVLSDNTKRGIYDRYGSIGLYVAEQFGEENVNTYFVLTSPWCKALFVFCGVITGCYLCCCFCCFCNFCCGKCKPRPPDEDGRYANLHEEELSSPERSPEHSQPIFIQPTATSDVNTRAPVAIELSEKSFLSSQGVQVAYGAEAVQKSWIHCRRLKCITLRLHCCRCILGSLAP